MDTTTQPSTGNHSTKSELEKFKLFYEFAPTDKDRGSEKPQNLIRRSIQS